MKRRPMVSRRNKNPLPVEENFPFMLPINIRCNSCAEYIYQGTNLFVYKEEVLDEKYPDFESHQICLKCTSCSAKIWVRSDPKNKDYAVVSGGTKVAVSKKRKREAEEGGDAPKSLENTTLGSRTKRDEMKSMKLRKMLDLLVHTAQCVSAKCQYTNCSKVKRLFNHGIHCKISTTGGCVLCKKMWYLLQLHARGCKESVCHVPRCRDLKEHIRMRKQESDSRQKSCHDGDDETESCRGCQSC
ncbi:hypothetical protein ACJW30_05G138200 [Castanea mollissima]